MKVSTRDFLKEKKRMEREIKAIEKRLCNLEPEFPPPSDLRRATAKDICVGQLIWQLECDDGEPHWQIIEEVRDPRDDFKAFVAEDGCRYGLHDCWVEVGK